MNHKERIMSAVSGTGTDYLPFVPRLDLWYRANRLNGTLPARYQHASLEQITEDLDIGFHAIVPDFKDLEDAADEADRALGLYQLRSMPYRIELDDVERIVRYDGDITEVKYLTPAGTINTRVLYDDTMRRAGITVTHILEHAIKDVSDFPAVAHIFRNIKVIPDERRYRRFQDKIGERGVAVAFTSLAASPMHLIQRELMPVDSFFYALHDYPQEMSWLEDQISLFFTRVFEVVSQSSAEVVFSGANYDSSITYPPFFEKYIQPYLAEQAHILHQKGKFLLTHTDGENQGLLELYRRSNIDIADSICPRPMTKQTLSEVRQAFQGKITIWGGLPSICVLGESMGEYEFDCFLEHTLEEIGQGDHLILSLADTTPPAALFGRIEKINQACRAFGPIRPVGSNKSGRDCCR